MELEFTRGSEDYLAVARLNAHRFKYIFWMIWLIVAAGLSIAWTVPFSIPLSIRLEYNDLMMAALCMLFMLSLLACIAFVSCLGYSRRQQASIEQAFRNGEYGKPGVVQRIKLSPQGHECRSEEDYSLWHWHANMKTRLTPKYIFYLQRIRL
jgi:hypothetical protein